MKYRLEVVQLPVSDVDRAKAFYAEQLGFHVDHDIQPSEEMRVVQLTPEGSACSVVIGSGLARMEPGAVQGLQLIVTDIEAARAELIGRGADVGEVQAMGPADMDGSKFAFFSDPDGNSWALQEIRARE
jgi:predicted enzyme related to lactoylglutathione lyase